MNRSKRLILVITATIGSLILAMVPITSQVSPVQADPGWTKSSTAVSLDSEKYVIDSWVIKDGTTYKMWYTHAKTDLTISELIDEFGPGGLGLDEILDDLANQDLEELLDDLAALTASDIRDFLNATTTVIGYAESSNGTTWTVEEEEALTGACDGLWSSVGAPCVIKDDSTYKMWYTKGETDIRLTEFGNILDELDGTATERKNAILDLLDSTSTVICYATSNDGINWSSSQIVLEGSSGGAWDSVADPCVIKDDSTYKMWYTTGETDLTRVDLENILADTAGFNTDVLMNLIDGTSTVISYATSTNGIDWPEGDRDSNVLPGSSGGLWDSVADPSVVKVDSTYKMWYTNGKSEHNDRSDLQEILSEIEDLDIPGFLDDIAAGNLTAFITELTELDTTDLEALLDNTSTVIAYATSSDGSTWAEQNSELLEGASDGLWSSIGAPSVIQYGSSYEMWYTQGISAFTVGRLTNLLLGTSLSLGYAEDIPSVGPGGGIPPAEDYEEMDPEDAADELAEMDADDAADVLVEMDADDAADIIEEMDADDAADILVEMDADDAADILVEMDADDAADIIEETATETAADIMEEMASDEAADILEEVATEAVADILEEMDIDDAADVMEELSTDKLSETIPEMSEESLTERLPGLSPDTLYDIDPEVLFDSLPNAPTEQLISEEPPEPPVEAEAPIIVYTTPSGARYLAIRTWSGEWAVVMGTPMPLDKLMIKTKEALDNVETTVEIFEERPQEVAVGLAADQTVMAYISITFANATPEDIELGHMTFKVEKEWLEENSVHKWSVVLSRYDSELRQWITLPTKRVEEDSSYVYYTSPITQFSMFAISGSEDIPPVNFEVANLALNPTEAKTGQDITITADITNLSNEAGTYVASLWIDGTVEAGQDISLQANETKAVSFTVTRDVEGSYQVRLDRLFESFSVIEAIEAPAAFTASNLTITPAEVDIGEEITISVLITNTGDLSGSYEVVLKIDGVAIATKETTLAGGASETVTFTTAQDVAGTYSVTVDGLSETFEVKLVVPPKVINWRLIAIIAGVTAAIVVPLVIRRRRMLA